MASIGRIFIDAKNRARQRGIAFKFTKEQWIAWWHYHLGPRWIEKRGRHRGQYVMARKGDRGCYEPSNVRCITCGDNNEEKRHNGNHPHGETHGKSRLTLAQVRAIRSIKLPPKGGPSVAPVKHLAEKYKVSRRAIHDIIARRRWKHI